MILIWFPVINRHIVPEKLHNNRAKVRKRFLHDFFVKKSLALAEECVIITANKYSQKYLRFLRLNQKYEQVCFKNMFLMVISYYI